MGSIRDAVNESDRDFLIAVRDHLASVLDGTPPPHTIAGLTKQLMDVRDRLRDLEATEGQDDLGKAFAAPDQPLDPRDL